MSFRLSVAALTVGAIAFAESVRAADAPAPPAYPLNASANHRYLVDQNGAPFLLVGDAPQSLTVNLSEADAEKYFANREKYGFNSFWVNLLCKDYTAGRADGKTFDKIAPFTGFLAGHDGDPKYYDLAKPDEAYFARCDALIRIAAKHGQIIFLNPAETGSWLSIKDPDVLLHNGPDACRAYGQWVATRYKDFKNILWFFGNDFQTWHDAKSDAVVTAVALGIRDKDKDRLQTIELDYTVSSSIDDPQWEAICGLNAAYTYSPTYAEVLKDYNDKRTRPVFVVEANYEFESLQGPVTTAPILRKQEYWAMLSGATGEMYGNHFTWTFEGKWQEKLDTPGAHDIAIFKKFFEEHRWAELIPDQDHKLVTAGYGKFSKDGHVADNDYLTAARTGDGFLGIVYTPVARKFTVDLGSMQYLSGAGWFDPTNGDYKAIMDLAPGTSGTREFTTPGKNSAGDEDWVLVLEAHVTPDSEPKR